MVLYYVAGNAQAFAYAYCERLLGNKQFLGTILYTFLFTDEGIDILEATMPDIQLHKTSVLPDEWDSYSNRLSECWG